MKKIIKTMLSRPFFKQILKEWSLHVKSQQNPTMFANMYLEWMRDPVDDEGRQATTMFANFMRAREWPEMMKVLKPHLDKGVLAIFKSEAAAEFYDGFKAMVIEQIREYWEQFLTARKAQLEEVGPREWSPRKCPCGKPHAKGQGWQCVSPS